MNRDELITYLPAYMKEHKITQAMLARLIGVRQQTISGWINKKKSPSYKHYEKLLEIIGDKENETNS